MSNNTYPHEVIIDLISPKIKNAMSKLIGLNTRRESHWPKLGSTDNDYHTIFAKDNSHILENIIIPDLSIMQVPSTKQANYLLSIDKTILEIDHISPYPVLFIYEFIDQNSLVISKIHISIWCQNKIVYPEEDEIVIDKYKYMDDYIERLIDLLNRFPDLEIVYLNMTHDEYTIEMLTKNCKCFKITKVTEQRLRRHREVKLNRHHFSDKLKTINFKLRVNLEYLVVSMAPWTDPVTGMLRFYEPRPKEVEAWPEEVKLWRYLEELV